MSAETATEALVGWEDRLRGLGAKAVDDLRPGLTRGQVDALAAELQGGLPEEAAAIWMWHDGSDHGGVPRPGLRGLVPYRFFVPLRKAFAQTRHLSEITSELKAFAEPPGQALWYRPWWLVLLTGGGTTFVDCADPESPEAVVGLWDPHGQHLGRLTLHERVRWWHWALDTGYWWVDDDGLWDSDNDKRPEAVFGDIRKRHVLP